MEILKWYIEKLCFLEIQVSERKIFWFSWEIIWFNILLKTMINGGCVSFLISERCFSFALWMCHFHWWKFLKLIILKKYFINDNVSVHSELMMNFLQRKDQGQIKLLFVLNSVKVFSCCTNFFFFGFETTHETILLIV